jgi:hypothetical protein
MQKKEELSITTGNALLYYCFDVGNAIDLDKVSSLLGGKAERLSLSVERLSPNYIQYRKQPLLLRLGQLRITDAYQVEGVAKIYDFGVITIRLRVPLRGPLSHLRDSCPNFSGDTPLTRAATKAFEDVRQHIADLIHKPYGENHSFEDYVVFHVEQFSRRIHGSELLANHSGTLARVLRCEPHELSTMELNDALKNPLSYYTDDLVLVDSGAAFVYSPKHAYDVHDILEYAIIELLELRHYDWVLDNVLEQAHTDVHVRRPGINPFSRAHRELAEVRLEVTDVVEKVENTLKLIGDMYLAKVYNVAAERFGLAQWKESVRYKLQTVQGVYQLLTDRINARRFLVMEIVITVSSAFYILELIMGYLKG